MLFFNSTICLFDEINRGRSIWEVIMFLIVCLLLLNIVIIDCDTTALFLEVFKVDVFSSFQFFNRLSLRNN